MLRYLGIYPCEKYGPWKVPGISALLLLYKTRTLDSLSFLVTRTPVLIKPAQAETASVCRKTAEDLKF